MYGARFTSTIQTPEQAEDWRAVWKSALADLSAEQIKTALEACAKKCEWPPSTAEFRALCVKPLDYERMFINAANGQYPDKLTYWAAQSFGAYDLRRMSYPPAKDRWITIVDTMAAEHTLPNIPDQTQPRLPAPGATIQSETALAGLEAVKACLSTNPSRKWACEPKSQAAVNLMFSNPPMLEEIEIATKNGYIVGKEWIPPHKRGNA